MINTQEYTCKRCGKVFENVPSKSPRYCSQDCYYLDKGPTTIEEKTESSLVDLGIAYYPQYRFGRYLVDFFLPSLNICLEVDGNYWHSLPGAPEKDARKDKYLLEQGYQVVRISESDINSAECVTTLVAQRLGLL